MVDSVRPFSPQVVTVFGGSGFLGRYVVQALARRNYRIRVAVRRPNLAGHVIPFGKVGQIHAVQANLRFPSSIQAAVQGVSAVVNLVGILQASGRQSFDAVQADGARNVAEAAAAAGARIVRGSSMCRQSEPTRRPSPLTPARRPRARPRSGRRGPMP